MVAAAELEEGWRLEVVDGFQVLRLRAPRTKDIDYVRRTIGEFVMPLAMYRQLRKSPLAGAKWDGVVWYAPSIFLGPLARSLKKSSGCKGYLIIRDIFPEWAVDIGLMGRGLPYWFFDAVARYQYSVADVIGVQTPGNLAYFDRWRGKPSRSLEVLQNWLDKPARVRCPLRISETKLAGRKVFVYAGNMGVAQGMEILLDLAERLQERSEVGFLFVGRGSDAARLKMGAQRRSLGNVLFFDELHPDEIPDLYAQCSVGIVTLDPRHKSHNIPGKFLTYLQSGLPVLANVNPGNDLAAIIRREGVGKVCETNDVEDMVLMVEALLGELDAGTDFSARCKELFEREFSAERAVKQIVAGLSA